LVDAGGDMRVGNAPPGGWKIGVPESNETTISLENRASATSGDTFRFIEFDGVRYSHIIDPKTGYGLTTSSIVRVTAPTAREADALASACSILGPEGSNKLLKTFPDAEVRFVNKQ
jgi:thiamine biosynthesis lipoprotein